MVVWQPSHKETKFIKITNAERDDQSIIIEQNYLLSVVKMIFKMGAP